ncbi:MAG: ribonuclease HII [Phyllobacteriaceae bacterium]|nr:ribonuclease HII [Phyllobacteriaceae bacterium]
MPRPRADSLLPFVDHGKPARDFKPAPDFSFEASLIAGGCRNVAGVDEAGRGPLAGPVVVAAVVLDPACIPAGLDDSKALSQRMRQTLFDVIMAQAQAVSVVSLAAPRIDADNILAATMAAMARALDALAIAPGHALIDGNRLPRHLPCPATALVKGDARSVSIAAASIVAKVMRDRMMVNADAAHPAYGFAAHKGYGGAAHMAAIGAHGGVARLHRFSFAPLKHEGAP